MKSYTEKDRLDRKRSETKQLVIGLEKRDRSLDWRIVARPESKCGERKGGMGVGEKNGNPNWSRETRRRKDHAQIVALE